MSGLLGPAEGLLPEHPLCRVGTRIHVVRQTTSTNDLALHENDGADDGDGYVYLAEKQTAGRGRRGHHWHAPHGAAVLCSVRLIEPARAEGHSRMSVAAGLAVHQAIMSASDVRPVLDWPNDVLVGNRKLAGVLVEARPLDHTRHVVAVGVGINCLQQTAHFPPELRDQATSLERESRLPIDRREVVRALLAALDYWLAAQRTGDAALLAREWMARSRTIGSSVRVPSNGQVRTGVVVDLDPEAGLLVSLTGGERRWFCPPTVRAPS